MIANGRLASDEWLEVVCYLTAAYFQTVSRACTIDYYFSPPQKRLMSPENSTRKVNTILKCQEINDIVLSSYGSVGEGDKCLALFTHVPPYLWSFSLPHSHSLCLCVHFSFILHLPFFFTLPGFVSSSFPSADHALLMPRRYSHCCT